MYKEKTTISKMYIRLDRSVLYYLLLKNDIKHKSKIYRYVTLCINRYHLRSLDIVGIADLSYRLYRLSHRTKDTNELNVHNFIQDLNLEFCRRVNMSDFGLPKIKIDIDSLYDCVRDILMKFDMTDQSYIRENIQAYFGTKIIGILNIRVFEDVILEYFRFKHDNGKIDYTSDEYLFVGNTVMLSNKIYAFYVKEALNQI